MTQVTIKWTAPTIINLWPTIVDGVVRKISIELDWGAMGVGNHTIYKENGSYVWTDLDSPIPVRKFNSISQLLWEYELPKSLESELKKIV